MNGSFKMIMLHATFRNSGNYYKRNRDCQCLGKFMPEQKVIVDIHPIAFIFIPGNSGKDQVTAKFSGFRKCGCCILAQPVRLLKGNAWRVQD